MFYFIGLVLVSSSDCGGAVSVVSQNSWCNTLQACLLYTKLPAKESFFYSILETIQWMTWIFLGHLHLIRKVLLIFSFPHNILKPYYWMMTQNYDAALDERRYILSLNLSYFEEKMNRIYTDKVPPPLHTSLSSPANDKMFPLNLYLAVWC